MLTFTQSQIDTFQTSWQVEQLRSQLPGVLAQLAEKHPEFYARNTDEQHQYHARKLIEQAVPLGYTETEQIQELLDLEYQTQLKIYDHKSIQPLYQASWLQPQDRLNGIQTLVALKDHEDRNRVSAYRLLDDYPLQQRCQDIAAQTAVIYSDDSQAMTIQMLRQALYHALLKDCLQTSQGWQAWKSNWQQAEISLEHTAYKRRIQFQTTDNQVLKIELDDSKEALLLILHVPDQLNGEQHSQISSLLQNWALELQSIGQMQEQIDQLDSSETETHDTDSASNPVPGQLAGESHA